MIEVEVRGFLCKIDEDVFDDADLFDIAIELDAGNRHQMMDYVNAILGLEQKEAVKNHLRDENGRCRLTDLLAFTNEAINAAAQKKHGDVKN